MIIVIITGSRFKLKRQENQTEFELDANETIVSVTTGESVSQVYGLRCIFNWQKILCIPQFDRVGISA